MRNIPVFTTQNGVASLTLEEIPYKGCAYVRVQDSSDTEAFLQECTDFCVAVGAGRVYATGVGADKYPFYTSIVQMQQSITDIPDTDATLCPVQNSTLEQWRNIYNLRMADVTNAATMTISKAQKALEDGSCYFVYKGDCMLGIGMVSGNTINALASVVPGSGTDILLALCQALEGGPVCVEVSSTNTRAVSLYKKLGFAEKCRVADWYQIF